MNKYWLISNEDFQEIERLLNKVYNTSFEVKAALHILSTGLHKTDTIPGDFSIVIDNNGEID